MTRLHWTAILLLLATSTAHAHGGGLDRHGCHNDRRSGGHHCHRGSAPAPAPQRLGPPSETPAPRDGFSPGGAGPPGAFRNCAEARAAGAAPVRRGDPGYGPHLDRDNDGIGCEPYRGR